MIKQLATKMAAGIVEVVPEYSDRVGRIRHTISFLLNIVPIIVITLVVGWLTGHMADAAIALISFGLLRQISGGIHLGSSEVCIIVTTVGATLISFSNFDATTVNIMTGLGVILTTVFTPSRIEGKTSIPSRYFPWLRIPAALLVASNFIIGSSVVATAFLVQSMTLVRLKGGETRR